MSFLYYYGSCAAAALSTGGNVSYGADPNFDGGTTGDYFVATDGDDSNTGTSIGDPFLTIDKAVTTAGLNDTIKVRGGTYREQTSLLGKDGVTISRYSNEKPILTGAELLTGAVACTSGDSAVVGSNWANMFKATILAADAPSFDAMGLNLHEDGERLDIASDSDSAFDFGFMRTDPNTWHEASAMTDNGTEITGFTDATVISNYTTAQLTNAKALLIGDPNITAVADITGVSGGDTVSVDPIVVRDSGNPFETYYSLLNILPAMQQGEWGYVEDSPGAGDITVYFWPNNPANVNVNIEYSDKDYGIDVATGENISLLGIEVRQQGGDGNFGTGIGRGGICVGHRTNATASPRRSGMTIRHCTFGHNSFVEWGYGAVYLSDIDDVTFERNTIESVGEGYGAFFNGSSDSAIRNCLITEAERHGVRYFGGGVSDPSSNVEVSYNRIVSCGREVHSNKMNFYTGCDNVLVWGNKFEDCFGYFTWQVASNLIVAFNEIPVDNRDASGRALVDQNDGQTPPDVNGVNYFFNNESVPNPNDITDGDNWDLGDTVNNQEFNWYNNIIAGGGVGTSKPASALGDQKNNLRTVADVNPYYTDVTDLDGTPATLIYNDPANSDFTYNAGTIVGAEGFDMSTIISGTLQARFPSFDFTKDIDGNTIDWNDPHLGPAPTGVDYPQSAPDAFTAGQWTLADATTGGQLNVTINSLPDDNNSPITDIEYELDDSGSWVSTGGTGSFSITGLTDDQAYDVVIRAVNAFGNGADSDIKIGTPTTAAFSPTWADFSGAWLERGSLTGASDSTDMIMFATYEPSAADIAAGSDKPLLSSTGSNDMDYVMNTGDNIRCLIADDGGVTQWDMLVNSHDLVAGTKYGVLVSVDSNSFGGKVYVVDLDTGNEYTQTDATAGGQNVSFTSANWLIGAINASGGFAIDGRMERAQLWSGVSTDIAVAANRRYFYDTDGTLEDPQDAITQFGTPLVSVKGANMIGTAGSTVTNDGSGGDFTIDGGDIT